MSSATPSVEIIPGHRDHRSGDRNKLITITPESVITIVRNADHDHTGTAITIVRNQRSRSSGIPKSHRFAVIRYFPAYFAVSSVKTPQTARKYRKSAAYEVVLS